MTIQDGFFTRCLLTTSLLFSTCTVYASGTCTTGNCVSKVYKGQCSVAGYDCPQRTLHGLLSLLGGYGYSHIGKSQTFVSEDIAYAYDADNDVQSQPYGGVTAGIEFPLPGGMLLDMTVGYYSTAAYHADGNITIDGVEPEFPHYNYRIIGRQALLEIKLLGDASLGFHPYISVGAGESFNKVYGYDTNATETPIFNNNVSHNFSFSGGIGLEMDLSSFARFGVGYRYANFGDADLGKGHFIDAPNVKTDNLEMSNFNTQAWLIQFTVII